MPLVKPTIGQGNWGETLNTALDYLDEKTADFTFTASDGEGESSITIHNHDMLIQTTRDGSQDSDIDINSADDVWITANDSVEITSVTDDVRIYTNDGSHEWSFQSNGEFRFPDGSLQTTAFNGEALGDIKTRTWGYPTPGAIAIMPSVDNESISLKSSDSAAIRWHVRNNGASSSGEGVLIPLSATVTPSGDVFLVEFTFAEENSVPTTSEHYYQVTAPNSPDYEGAYLPTAATSTTLTLSYSVDPGVFNPTEAVIAQPSVYSQYEVDSSGAHVKVANWSDPEVGYSHYWTFGTNGVLSGPAMGGVIVPGIWGTPDSDLYVASNLNLVLTSGELGGVYLDNSSDGLKQVATIGDLPTGATGSFTSQDGKTVTVTNGIITSIV